MQNLTSTDSSRDASSASTIADVTLCQLQRMPDATVPLRVDEKVLRALDRKGRRILHIAKRIATDPAALWRRISAVLSGNGKRTRAIGRPVLPAAGSLAPLRAGELVRVRSRDEIRATLDESGCHKGLSYLPAVMDRYCSRTFVVHRRVERFFDERRWQMLKLRDVVILDGVYCESSSGTNEAWSGCDRSCFLFWKEAWLERVDRAGAG